MDKKKSIVQREKATRYDYTIKTALDEEVDEVSYPYLEREYDDRGNLIREISFDNAGEIQEYFEYRYDNLNRRIELKNFYNEDEMAEQVQYTYGEGDNPISAIKIYADGSEEAISFIYDDEGRLRSRVVVNDEGEEDESEEWRYEGSHEVSYEKREYGEPVFREMQEYDEQGKVTRVILWEGPDGKVMINKLSYDESGRRNRIEKTDEHGKVLAVIHINSFDGEEPAEIAETTSGGTTTTRYSYDQEGRPVLQQEFSQDGTMTNEIIRTYIEEGLLKTTEVTANRRGEGMNIHYRIEYEYRFFD
ncbi:MAG: hypothetical protein R6V49_06535 [Bacteroidales bacterium]